MTALRAIGAEELLAKVREIDALAEAVVDAMQSGETPDFESLGIAFVAGDGIRDICEGLERDLVSDLTTADCDRDSDGRPHGF